MTQQVRTGYRKHRKAAWGLALLLVAAIAAVTIPLASGASPNQTLRFVVQPTSLLQSSTPATTTSVAVAVFSGGPNPVNSNPPPTPSLTASGAGDISNFDVSAPTYDSGTKHWNWTVTPKSSANSGVYTFGATLGDMVAAPSSSFRVAQFVCPPSCDGTSNNTAGQGKLKIANTLGSSIALDFQPGGAPVPPAGCEGLTPGTLWNRAFYEDANGDPVYFPAVALDFTWGADMLQVTYLVRNSEWVLTSATRGNQDIEFCAEARHQRSALNDGAHPFAGKYGPAQWDGTNYSGVLTTVSNPSKVKTNGTGSPAVCGRGSQDISGETWRMWTICIPYDWDWGVKPG
jgi:hypothetical protein